MKWIFFLFGISSLISCNNPEKKPDAASALKAGQPLDSVAIAKRLEEIMTLGAMHKMMAATSGMWDIEVKYWQDEKSAPTIGKGTCENKMILNGHYLQLTCSYKNPPPDTSLTVMIILGYNTSKKIFTCTWQDNVTTGVVYTEGTFDSTTRFINLKGHYDDETGSTTLRQEFRLKDDKHQEIHFYGTHEGEKEQQFLEITMTGK